MPFKSEKQRRYLWANEPEIARDWTDTYGSGIHKALGGRIGFYRGSDRHAGTGTSQSQAPSSGPHGNQGSSRGSDRGPRDAPDRHGSTRTSHHPGVRSGYTPTHVRSGINRPAPREDADPGNYFSKANYVRRSLSPNFLGSVNPFDKKDYLAWAKQNEEDSLINEGVYGDRPGWQITKDAEMLNKLEKLGVKSYGDINRLTQSDFETLMPDWQKNPGGEGGEGGGLPYIWPYEMASAPIEEEEIIETDPINRYAGSYRVRPEFLIAAEGGRVPAAFGGIMDSYTGRRAYGLGSVFKKITSIPKKAAKAVKKLASSPIGKLALGYLATAGLAGYGAGNMQGFYKPGNFMGNIGKSWTRFAPKMLQKEALVDTADAGTNWKKKVLEDNLLTKGLGWIKENPTAAILGGSLGAGLYTAKQPVEELDSVQTDYDNELAKWEEIFRPYKGKYRVQDEYLVAEGGRIGKQEGGLMDLGGMEKDYRNDGGFVPIGGQEKADDVPARLSRNEFVFTADAVRNAGGGDIDKGAQVMENVMKNLEAGGKVSEESQGQGAQEMFEVSERLSEVV
jgi:hypothetical protein